MHHLSRATLNESVFHIKIPCVYKCIFTYTQVQDGYIAIKVSNKTKSAVKIY